MKVAAAKRLLERAAREVGARVEDDSAGHDICFQLIAPDGKWWAESYGPHLAVVTARGPQAWLDDAVADGIHRMGSGFVPAEE